MSLSNIGLGLLLFAFDLPPTQIKYPAGWNPRRKRGASSLNLSAADTGSFAMATLATKGDACNAALSGPTRNSRTTEWAPSLPMSRLPDSEVPSSKVAVAFRPSDDTATIRLPHYGKNKHFSSQNHRLGEEEIPTLMSRPWVSIWQNRRLANLIMNGIGSAAKSSVDSVLNINNLSSGEGFQSSICMFSTCALSSAGRHSS